MAAYPLIASINDGCSSRKTWAKVSTEMALNVLAYNIKRVIAIVGVGALLEAMTI